MIFGTGEMNVAIKENLDGRQDKFLKAIKPSRQCDLCKSWFDPRKSGYSNSAIGSPSVRIGIGRPAVL